jgi:hypothetical protein
MHAPTLPFASSSIDSTICFESSYVLLDTQRGTRLKPIADTRYIRMAPRANTLHHDFTRHHRLVDVEQELLVLGRLAC